jgi:magnesium-transporting ATPase (P-type)
VLLKSLKAAENVAFCASICTDKNCILTENKLRVNKVFLQDGIWEEKE